MSSLHSRYTKLLTLFQSIETASNVQHQKRPPKLSDIELIALSLTAQVQDIDSESYLFESLPEPVKGPVERHVYNRRRRALTFKINLLQQTMAENINADESYHLIDSRPLEICQLARAKRSNLCQQNIDSAPDFGCCAAQNAHYFGYKRHVVCTLDGVIKAFDLSKASTHPLS